MATLAERLASVQAAIAAIEGGAQSITIDNRTYRRPDLKVLYDQERDLLNQTSRAAAGARRTLAEF